ncbi:MAG: hypothetical protein MUF51_06350 [Vicinamibacteria bacterium]|nr:hypothetical protein [Vicinamibacteria bacterium]
MAVWCCASAIAFQLILLLCDPHKPLVGDPDRGLYNLQTDAFLAGQLHLPIEVPQRLLDAGDETNPNRLRRPPSAWDLSYYDHKLYLYFGPAPVALCYLPARILFDWRMPSGWAAWFFWAGGLMWATAALLRLSQRLASRPSSVWIAAGIFWMGLGTLSGALMHRPFVYEVALACGLFCFWAWTYFSISALDEIEAGRTPYVRAALAGAMYMLAIASRPLFLLGLPVMLILAWPILRMRRTRLTRFALIATLVAPLAAGGAMLALYNYARFGDPCESGHRYQLTEIRKRVWSIENAPYNLYLYLLHPVRVAATPPYLAVRHEPIAAIPPGAYHSPNANTVGLFQLPAYWAAAITLMILIRRRMAAEGAWIRRALLILLPATINYGVLLMYSFANTRYWLDILPGWALGGALIFLQRARDVDHHARRTRLVDALLLTSVAVTILVSLALGLSYQG